MGDPALPAIDHTDNQGIVVEWPRAGAVIGGEGAATIRFRLTISDWWRETLRISYCRVGGKSVSTQDVQLTPDVRIYEIDWNPPIDSSDYRIEIEEVDK